MERERLPDSGLRALVAAAALVVVVAGLRAGVTLLAPLAVAALVAVTSHPLVAWLERRRLPRWAAVLVTLFLLILALLGPGVVVLNAATTFMATAPAYGARLNAMSVGWLEWLRTLGVDTSSLADLLNWTAALNLAGGLVANAAAVASGALLILILVGFMLAGGARTLASAVAVERVDNGRLHRAVRVVQRYLRVKTAISLATGVLLGLWTAALGVDFAVLWGLLAFILNYVPNFGSILAGLPPVALALVQAGPGRAAVVMAGFLVVNVVLGTIVEPVVMGRRLQMSPLTVVLSLVFWGWAWGAMGMVLAVPITMSACIFLEESPEWGWAAALITGGEPSGRPDE